MLSLLPLFLASCVYITDKERSERWDLDGDGVERPLDCDDGDKTVTTETTWYEDEDQDGYGRDTTAVTACTAPSPTAVEQGGDCNDEDPDRNPGRARRL